MHVNRRITSSSLEALMPLLGSNMAMGLRVTVSIRETKINEVEQVPTLADTHHEVFGLDIAMNIVLGVNVFDARNLLV